MEWQEEPRGKAADVRETINWTSETEGGQSSGGVPCAPQFFREK